MSLQAIQSVFYRRSLRSPTATGAATAEQREQQTRQKIEREFLDTERAYVDRLEVLVEVFMIPLQAWFQEICADEQTAEQYPYLNKQTGRTLFSNVQEILRVNKYILEELEVAANQSHEAIAQVFVTTVPFLQQYLFYYTNYNQASELLSHLMSVSRDFRLFLRACEYQPRCKGEQLPSLLIQPVQRIPRYRLLLETLLKHTPHSSSEYTLLEQAIEKIGLVLVKLNGEIAKKQDRDQMQVLASRFENEVHMIAPHRQLIKEGPLLKISLTWGARQERYVVLMNDMIIYGKKQFTADKFSSSHELTLQQAILLTSEGDDEMFFILLTPQKSIYFVAPSVEERDSWVENFRLAFQNINRAEQGRHLDLIIETNGQASLSTTSPLERRWVRRKIPLTNVSEDGAVSRREYIVPDHVMNSVRGIFPINDALPLQQKPFSRSPALSMRNSVLTRKNSNSNLRRNEQASSERRFTVRPSITRGSVPNPKSSPPAQRALELELDAENPPSRPQSQGQEKEQVPEQAQDLSIDASFVSPTKSSVLSTPLSSIAPTPDTFTPTSKDRRAASEASSPTKPSYPDASTTTPTRSQRVASDFSSPSRVQRSGSDIGTPTRAPRTASDAPTPTRINRATLAPLASSPMNPLYQHTPPTKERSSPKPMYSTPSNDDATSGSSVVAAAFNFLGGLFFTPVTVRSRPSQLDSGDIGSARYSESSGPSTPTTLYSDDRDYDRDRESLNGKSTLAPPPLPPRVSPPQKPPRTSTPVRGNPSTGPSDQHQYDSA